MKPELLFKVEVSDYRPPLAEVFTVIDYPPMGALPDVDVCRRARVLVTTGFTGASRSDMEALTALSLICCVGTGYEGAISLPRNRPTKVPSCRMRLCARSRWPS